jgi:hypothetical protein
MARKSLSGWAKALILAAVIASGANAASAQYQLCASHRDIVAWLSDEFQERQFAFGLIGQTEIMEVYVGATGSWTVIVTDVAGRSCIVAAGENWEITVKPGGDPGHIAADQRRSPVAAGDARFAHVVGRRAPRQ